MNSGSYQITRVSVDELESLRKLSINTFNDTFSITNAATHIEAYLSKAFSEEQLKTELQNPDSFFYFLKKGEEVHGYLKLNTKKAQSDLVLDNALEIERIYIVESHQGQGLGKTLINFSLEAARDRNLICIWLGVWEKNEKAIAFYKRHGFEVFADHPFKLGGDLQRDLLMKRLV